MASSLLLTLLNHIQVIQSNERFKQLILIDYSLGLRVIRVFNREGCLQSTSEPVSQLEQCLSWKSSGASGLLTTTITIKEQNKKQVAFFEKNGLRHGEFDIDLSHQVKFNHIISMNAFNNNNA